MMMMIVNLLCPRTLFLSYLVQKNRDIFQLLVLLRAQRLLVILDILEFLRERVAMIDLVILLGLPDVAEEERLANFPDEKCDEIRGYLVADVSKAC